MGYIDFTEERIAEHIKLGYGQGCGANYKPWIGVGSFSNKGRGSRVFGIKFPRKHDLLSDLETKFYYWLEWNENVIDIREQYPLFPVFETEEIARLLGVEYPPKIGGNNSFVMTTDFFVTVKNKDTIRYIAYGVKQSKDLTDRVLEKQSIEKMYWNRRGVKWILVTEKSIDINECENMRFFQERYDYPLKVSLDEAIAGEPLEQLKRSIAVH